MPLYAIGGLRPAVAEDAWIAPSADLIGDVQVAQGASIWFGAVKKIELVIEIRAPGQSHTVVPAPP